MIVHTVPEGEGVEAAEGKAYLPLPGGQGVGHEHC